jgi:hypothetical protein
MKTNWLRMKMQFLAYMNRDKLLQLEYRDDAAYNLLKPDQKAVKEISYMQQQTTSQPVQIAQSGTIEELKHQERQAKIDALKKHFMAPVDRRTAKRGSIAISLT